MTAKVRFSISLDIEANEKLVEWAGKQRPKMNKQYLIELAVERLLEQLESRQLVLPLDPKGE